MKQIILVTKDQKHGEAIKRALEQLDLWEVHIFDDLFQAFNWAMEEVDVFFVDQDLCEGQQETVKKILARFPNTNLVQVIDADGITDKDEEEAVGEGFKVLILKSEERDVLGVLEGVLYPGEDE